MTLRITLRERGQPEVVSLEDWAAYSLEVPMRALAAQRIVRLTRTAAGIMVTPFHHVGELRVPGASLEILPKSLELLVAMEALALRARTRETMHREPQFTQNEGDDEDPAGAFVRALLASVVDGIPWDYGLATEPTSFPRGKLVFGATIRRFAARGLRHRVVVTIPRRDQDAVLVRVVRAAHGCLPSAPGATAKLILDAETLMQVLDEAMPFLDLPAAIRAAEAAVEKEWTLGREISAELALRSLDLLKCVYRAAGIVRPVPGGIARFRDLEDLWERCVLRLVECCPAVLGGGVPKFHGLAGSGCQLFLDGGPELDPDVVATKDNTPVAIIDAKYKRLEGGAAGVAADLYQLYAYVRRTFACLGLIVHFSESAPAIAIVGTTPEAVPIISVSLSPDLLLRDGEIALDRLLSNSSTVAERIEQSFRNGLGNQGGDSVSDLSGNVLLGS